MRIIGIDPGSRITGFGVIDINQHHHYQYINSGVVKTNLKDSLPQKIYTLATHLHELIELYQPHEIAIEKVFINLNAAASLVLGEARGAIIASIMLKQVPIFEYTALQVKKSVVGNGKAPKEQVQHMVKEILKLSKAPKADAADALAIALTHIFRSHSMAGLNYINYIN